MVEIYLVRHAESEGNIAPQYISGQSNHLPVTANGYIQAKRLANRFVKDDLHFDKYACSTALRAQQTMRVITDSTGVNWSVVQISDQLLELDQGEWVGRLRDEVYTTEMRDTINRNNWDFKAPGGESQREVDFSPQMTYKIEISNSSASVIHWTADRGWGLRSINDVSHLRDYH